jgi:hypothetical protein
LLVPAAACCLVCSFLLPVLLGLTCEARPGNSGHQRTTPAQRRHGGNGFVARRGAPSVVVIRRSSVHCLTSRLPVVAVIGRQRNRRTGYSVRNTRYPVDPAFVPNGAAQAKWPSWAVERVRGSEHTEYGKSAEPAAASAAACRRGPMIAVTRSVGGLQRHAALRSQVSMLAAGVRQRNARGGTYRVRASGAQQRRWFMAWTWHGRAGAGAGVVSCPAGARGGHEDQNDQTSQVPNRGVIIAAAQPCALGL